MEKIQFENFTIDKELFFNKLKELRKKINSSKEKILIINEYKIKIYTTREKEKNIDKKDFIFYLFNILKDEINLTNIKNFFNNQKDIRILNNFLIEKNILIDIFSKRVFFNSKPTKRNKEVTKRNKEVIKRNNKVSKKITSKNINKNINDNIDENINNNIDENINDNVDENINDNINEKEYFNINKDNNFNNEDFFKKEILDINLLNENENFSLNNPLLNNIEEINKIDKNEKEELLNELSSIFNVFENKKISIILGIFTGLIIGIIYIYFLNKFL